MIVEFQSNLQEVLAALQRAKGRYLETVGDKAVEYAQNAAPVDTGNMKSSITHERYDDDTEIYGTSESNAPYKSVDYAPYVELGTSRQRAQPFIRPATEGHGSEFKQILQDILQNA